MTVEIESFQAPLLVLIFVYRLDENISIVQTNAPPEDAKASHLHKTKCDLGLPHESNMKVSALVVYQTSYYDKLLL